MTYESHSQTDTKEIAAAFAKRLQGGEVVFLQGELGAGKTSFVQGVAEALGVTEPVRSPTFTVMNHYAVSKGTIRQLIHLDLYRLEAPEDLAALGLDEVLGQRDTIVFIEWPRDLVFEPHLTVAFEIKNEATRLVSITP